MIRFPSPSATNAEPPFSARDVLGGREAGPESADGAGTIRIDVGGRPELIRFYGARHDADAHTAVIFLEGDVVRYKPGTKELECDPYYLQQTPRRMQEEAEACAAELKRNFINLARPGTYGSTGDHRQRRRPREGAVVDAAVSRLKEAFGWTSIDLAGLSGGGHLVAALLARRTDIRDAVIASGNVAVRHRLKERGLDVDVTGYADFYDPIDHAGEVARHPPQKLVMLTDPGDGIVSASTQSAYADALRRAGVAVEQRTAAGIDPKHHIIPTRVILRALSE